MREDRGSEVRDRFRDPDPEDLLRAGEIRLHAGLAVAREAAFRVAVARDERLLAGRIAAVGARTLQGDVLLEPELRYLHVHPVRDAPCVGAAGEDDEAHG